MKLQDYGLQIKGAFLSEPRYKVLMGESLSGLSNLRLAHGATKYQYLYVNLHGERLITIKYTRSLRLGNLHVTIKQHSSMSPIMAFDMKLGAFAASNKVLSILESVLLELEKRIPSRIRNLDRICKARDLLNHILKLNCPNKS